MADQIIPDCTIVTEWSLFPDQKPGIGDIIRYKELYNIPDSAEVDVHGYRNGGSGRVKFFIKKKLKSGPKPEDDR